MNNVKKNCKISTEGHRLHPSHLSLALHYAAIPGFSYWMNILLNWIQPKSNFMEKKLLNNLLNWIFLKKWYWIIFWIGFYREMNEWIVYIESIFSIVDWNLPSLSFFRHFSGTSLTFFWFDQYQWFPDYWIELSFKLNH